MTINYSSIMVIAIFFLSVYSAAEIDGFASIFRLSRGEDKANVHRGTDVLFSFNKRFDI